MPYRKATNCIHGRHFEAKEGTNTPIYPSSVFRYREVDQNIYPRYYNTPNQEVIIEKLCKLEGGHRGILFSSGMAAISTCLFSLLEPGTHMVLSGSVYGGTFYLVEKEMAKRGISYTFLPDTEVSSFEAAIQDNTRVIYLETPSNPLLQLTDIARVADLAKQRGCITVIDNTFASPINQNPLDLGIDVVLHSGTKYLGGHSDLCFGVVITSEELYEQMYPQAINYGGSLNALDCYLIERSLKTLEVRVRQQNANAQQIAEFLETRREVRAVHYPGLGSHPQHELAKAQMQGFGGMVAFELAVDNLAETGQFLDHLELIQPALSLGGVETIICSPSETSHIKMPKAQREAIGIREGLLRLSVGIEAVEDILYDLNQAFEKSHQVFRQSQAV
ncbi:MAG: PLP-dependent aspartate aminotransferase family protein [Bacteroidota bacterium]